MQRLNRVLDSFDSVSEWSGRIFKFIILAFIFVVLFEVIMRYIFNKPTIWAYELGTFIFGAVLVLGGAYSYLHKNMVNVDIVYSRLSLRAKAIVDIITFLFFLIFIGVLLWKGGEATYKALQSMERSQSAWAPLLWPSRIFIPLGAFLLLLQGITNFARNIITIVRGNKI